ncbi:MAG TPA: hypothetical protein VMU89_08290 [Thermomicrobiaceae bacterium]|nr:hypothetical protein [Thermomicrobiaceae bacterium]
MSSATEPTHFAIVSRRRNAFYLQRPDGSPLTFETQAAADSVCDALNREDPNDAEPEYTVTEVSG